MAKATGNSWIQTVAAAITNALKAAVDEMVKENAAFAYESGLSAKIVRKMSEKPANGAGKWQARTITGASRLTYTGVTTTAIARENMWSEKTAETYIQNIGRTRRKLIKSKKEAK